MDCKWCHRTPHLSECELNLLYRRLESQDMEISELEVRLGTTRRNRRDTQSKIFALLRGDHKPATQLTVRAAKLARTHPKSAAKKRWERMLEKILAI